MASENQYHVKRLRLEIEALSHTDEWHRQRERRHLPEHKGNAEVPANSQEKYPLYTRTTKERGRRGAETTLGTAQLPAWIAAWIGSGDPCATAPGTKTPPRTLRGGGRIPTLGQSAHGVGAPGLGRAEWDRCGRGGGLRSFHPMNQTPQGGEDCGRCRARPCGDTTGPPRSETYLGAHTALCGA
ncbi:hypothetical protein NDU88_004535 [Pleurodeles waltl]|uniref:Uncharacterized protein n=1 Tax=Pleurodeles waltl TaxID=8319 RepID=A0AAV7QEU1_PLEWA|nr:hypothetical protein NDU88_004535 [Pleurodeles waltl]